MGAGIAVVFAKAGHPVKVYEPNADARDSLQERASQILNALRAPLASLDHISVCDELEQAVSGAAFITEAAPEKPDLKRSIFADVERMAASDAVIASNTSVIPIGQITEGLASAERMVGTHWWNPPYLVPLVEVVQTDRTSTTTIWKTLSLLTSVGKSPAHIKKDVPGFVANRLQHALWREAIAMVAEGICDAQTLDHCVKSSFGLRLAVLGPLENADLVGLDLTLDIHKTIIPELDRSAGPNPFLEEQIAEGKLGCKSGEGFRAWTEEEVAELRNRLTQHLVKSVTTG